MTPSNHDLGFRPSHFPALEKCIHQEQKEGESEARERGKRIHMVIANVCQTGTADPNAASPESAFAIFLVLDYRKQGWNIFAIEQPVDILDEDGQVITQGTIDLVLERNREFLIIDWKTGDKSDYTAQLRAYKVAWSDLHPEATDIRTLIAYVDLRETESVNGSWEQAAKGVQALWEKWRTRDLGEYKINEYCSYCAIRGDCPAWRYEAVMAFESIHQTGESISVPGAVDALRNDPVNLEKFLLTWDRCKTLVEDEWKLKDSLKTHMELGFKSDHFLLVVVKDKKEVVESVDPEGYLLKVVKEIGTNKAAGAIKVDPHKALEVWKAFTDKPFPLAFEQVITDKPGYSYVMTKGKSGRGDSAKKRKELE